MQGIMIERNEDGYYSCLTQIDESTLPSGDVMVRVEYSSLNYKDALAITGKAPVVRQFPMIPGIDLVGTIEQSSHPEFDVGQRVVVNGWGVGEVHWGGLAQKARLQGDWLIPLPRGMSSRQAMGIGTAGYTAMLCIMALERHGVSPSSGPILVTGATGGVGSMAVTMLAKLGYTVVALTGRLEESEYLKSLGAREIVPRSEFSQPGKPLGKERWAGVVDVVGTHVLANVCATAQYGGVVTACGLAGGMDFPATVAPFILRGITLVGIDSVQCAKALRLEAWRRLQQDLDRAKLEMMVQEIGLGETIAAARKMLSGGIRGRIIVDVNQ